MIHTYNNSSILPIYTTITGYPPPNQLIKAPNNPQTAMGWREPNYIVYM